MIAVRRLFAGFLMGNKHERFGKACRINLCNNGVNHCKHLHSVKAIMVAKRWDWLNLPRIVRGRDRVPGKFLLVSLIDLEKIRLLVKRNISGTSRRRLPDSIFLVC